MKTEALDNTELAGPVAVEALVGEVGNWPGVTVAPEPRFGGPAFYVGRRQLGHLHEAGRRGAWADIGLPRAQRDELIAAGRSRPHSVVPDSGWLTVPVRTAADLAGAVEVFRLAYERATRKSARRDSPVPGLVASPPAELPFDRSLRLRAFLLERDAGDVMIYNAPTAAFAPARQYLNHRHEAGFGPARAPVFVHAADRDAVAQHMPVRAAFSRRHTLDDDLEVIPTPGHTPGATAYLWGSGAQRVLFTGDTILLRNGEWVAAVLDSSNREAYVRSLELIRELDFDVLVPWIASAGEPYHAVTTRQQARDRIDAILERVRLG